PLMPPPTTATTGWRPGRSAARAVDPGGASSTAGTGRGVGDDPRQAGAQRRVVVQGPRPPEPEPGAGGDPRGLDVEVVQHLQVVGGEPGGAHDDAAHPAAGELPEHLGDPRPEPRLG